MEVLDSLFSSTTAGPDGSLVIGFARDLSSPHMLVTYISILMLLVVRTGNPTGDPKRLRWITWAFAVVALREALAFSSRTSRGWASDPFAPPVVMLIEEWSPTFITVGVIAAMLRYLVGSVRPVRVYVAVAGGVMLALGLASFVTSPNMNGRRPPRPEFRVDGAPPRGLDLRPDEIARARPLGPRGSGPLTLGPEEHPDMPTPPVHLRWGRAFSATGMLSALWAAMLIWRLVPRRARGVMLAAAAIFFVRDGVWLLGWIVQKSPGPSVTGPLAVGIHFMGLSVICYLFIRERAAEMNVELESARRELEAANALLREKSIVDPLTGVSNRRQFDEMLANEWDRARRERSTLTLAIVDVDDFKRVNDEFGHLAGDETLKRVAASLDAAVRRGTDLVARYGGDEFAVLLPATPAQDASALLDVVREHVAESRGAAPPDGGVTLSVGVAEFAPHTGGEAADLIAQADAALYESKQAGRNRVTACDPSLVRVLAAPQAAGA